MGGKRAFLGNIYDITRVPKYNTDIGKDNNDFNFFDDDVEVSKKEIIAIAPVPELKFETTKQKPDYYVSNYENQRIALFCPCGETTELNGLNEGNMFNYNVEYGQKELKNKLTCQHCKREYKNLDNIMELSSAKYPSDNVISKRFAVKETDNFYALYTFATSVFISRTSKKPIFRTHGNKSLYLSKKIKAIKIKDGDKILTIPLRSLTDKINRIVDYMATNALFENVTDKSTFEIKIVDPLFRFCNIIESKCDFRDVGRIIDMLDKERNESYLNSMFCSNDNGYSKNLFENNNEYKVKTLSSSYSKMSNDRFVYLQYFKRRLIVMSAIYLYPPMATILFSFGIDKFISMLSDNHSSLMCSLKSLKLKAPTNPKDILETMFKQKVVEDYSKYNKTIEILKKEKERRKRFEKKFPDKRYPNESVIHSYNLKIPFQIKDIKKKTKNLDFKKCYIELFKEEDFDSAASVLFVFLDLDKCVFEDKGIIERMIYKSGAKQTIKLINSINNYSQRLTNFKFGNKYVFHLLKLIEGMDDYGSNNTINHYADTISMMVNLNLPVTDILKYKNANEIHHMHNTLTQSFRIKADKEMSKNLANQIAYYRNTEVIIEGVRFVLLDSVEKFYDESSIMSHCVKTYCVNVAKGHYVIYSVVDNETEERATLSISIRNNELLDSHDVPFSYSFNQLKSKQNRRAPNKIIAASIKFLKDKFKINVEAPPPDLCALPEPESIKQDNLNQNLLDI